MTRRARRALAAEAKRKRAKLRRLERELAEAEAKRDEIERRIEELLPMLDLGDLRPDGEQRSVGEVAGRADEAPLPGTALARHLTA